MSVTPGDVLTVVAQTIASQVEQANGLVEKINSVSDGNRMAFEILEGTAEATSLPADVQSALNEWQTWNEKAVAETERRRAEMQAKVQESLPKSGDVDVEALKEQYKELRSGIKSAQGFLATLPGYDPEKFTIPALRTLRGGTSTGTNGGGGKRPRLAAISIDGTPIEKVVKNAKGEDVSVASFTLAAQYLSKESKSKVEVKDLQAAAFSAAKTDDLSTLAGQTFDFVYSVGETNYTVQVTPRSE